MRPWRVPYPKFGAGPGLERVRCIAEELGVDLTAFGARSAAIVGSNGKGSTAAMTAALLDGSGSVGLFTSPHLLDINERFRIDDVDISDSELAQHWDRVASAAARTKLGSELGGFEFLFLIAADWFAARPCDFVVWEAGIGGRLDPVRLIEARRVALTSLDLEHTALLGNTLEEIARDKLDAAPAGADVFIAESCCPQREAIDAHCAERGVRAHWISARDDLASPLPGEFQAENTALAVALASAMAPFAKTDITVGLKKTRWPGRLEVLESEPLVVIDVGHTTAAVRTALSGFQSLCADRAATLVLGVSRDRDVDAIVRSLAPAFGRIVCTSARHKGLPASELARAVAAANPEAELIIAGAVEEAREAVLAVHSTNAVYVAGGLFLAAEFKAIHAGRDPATLAFF